MNPYSLSHLTDRDLLRGLTAAAAEDRDTKAALLAHLAEVDARRLHLSAGYASLHAYCVGALGLSEDTADELLAGATCKSEAEVQAIILPLPTGEHVEERVVPLSPQRFQVQLTIGQSTYDKLRYAQSLLSDQIPSGDLAQVIELAFQALAEELSGGGATEPNPCA
jgi:hypothetical protein